MGLARAGRGMTHTFLLSSQPRSGMALPTTVGEPEGTAEMDLNLRPQLRALMVGEGPAPVVLGTCTIWVSHSHPVSSPTRFPRLVTACRDLGETPHYRR